MSAHPKHVGRVPSHGVRAKSKNAASGDERNAASGDAACNAPGASRVGRVPSRGASPEGAKEGGNAWNKFPNGDAGSGDPAYNQRVTAVGRLPSTGGWRTVRVGDTLLDELNEVLAA